MAKYEKIKLLFKPVAYSEHRRISQTASYTKNSQRLKPVKYSPESLTEL